MLFRQFPYQYSKIFDNCRGSFQRIIWALNMAQRSD
jgi:hypothetical protein